MARMRGLPARVRIPRPYRWAILPSDFRQVIFEFFQKILRTGCGGQVLQIGVVSQLDSVKLAELLDHLQSLGGFLLRQKIDLQIEVGALVSLAGGAVLT